MGKAKKRLSPKQRFLRRQYSKGRTKKQAEVTWKMIRSGCKVARRRGMRPNPRVGTVIHGTLRSEDLIPAFIDVLDELIEESTFEPGADHPARVQRVGYYQDKLGDLEQRMGQPGYFDSEDADWDLEWLFEQLNEFAPEGTTFGAHPGDGADFGFWPVQEY